MKPKFFIPIILAIVIVAGLAWWASVRRAEVPIVPPAVNNLPIPPDQASWKTYRNEEYGFEMQYPNYWSICDIAQEEKPWSRPHFRTTIPIGCLKSAPKEFPLEGKISLLLRIYAEPEWFKRYPSQMSLLNFFQAEDERTKKMGIGTVTRIESGVTTSGIPFLINIACDAGCWGSYLIYLPKSLISISYGPSDPEVGQVLSTFRFTNP